MKVKKTKTAGTVALTKAVSNVTKIAKTKNKVAKAITDEKLSKNPLIKVTSGKVSKKTSTKIKANKKQSQKKLKAIKANENKFLNETSNEEIQEEEPYKSTRGIVYIGHIPYGFFESEMKEYFEQFGKVTRVRVARSKKTGKSRGYGYIEFENPDIAKIAAETMNNYLMCGRLLKATYIPPEKQHWGFFSGKPWTAAIYPKVANRIKELRKNESPISEVKHKKNVKKTLRKLAVLEDTLKNIGVKIKFKPKDIPKLEK